MFHISFVSCLRSLIPLCGRKIFFSLAKYVSPGAQKNGFEMKYASLQAQVHVYPHSEMLITKACKHIYCTYERQAQTQKHTVTNTHGKQSNTKHERRLICRCSKHSGATEREMWKECVGTYPHSKAVTNKSFSICLQGLCVIYPIQYSTMLRGYASILCMAFMQMKRWQWAKPLIWVSLWLQRLMQQKHHESTGKQNRGSSVEIVHRIGGTW